MTEQQLLDLFHQMTLEEKIGQLVQLDGGCFGTDAMAVGPREKLGVTEETVRNCGSVLNVLGAEKVHEIQDHFLAENRLKIPLLFMADVIYGYQTVFPIPLGLGSTWNPNLIREDYKLIAEEACSDGDMVTFSPPADLIRDARWGRCLEMPGEDPVLISHFSKAMVEGFQNTWEKGKSVASCLKHFAGYGAPEAGREYNTVDMNKRRFLQDFLPGYKSAVDAGCELVMTSFNTVDEIPATANKWLMDDILRKEWGFNGVIITDYAAISELKAHGVAADDAEAAKLAINATVDIDMKTSCYANNLADLVARHEIDEAQIDAACYRILTLKNKLGLFEDPYYGCSVEKRDSVICSPEKISAARKTANRSMVLLKNDDILPLKRNKQKIALIGPYADSLDIVGMWAVHADHKHSITIKQAMENVLDNEYFTFTKGCDFLDDYSSLGEFGFIPAIANGKLTPEQAVIEHENALTLAKEADVVVLAMGEHMLQSGESGSRTDITLPEPQKQLLHEIKALDKKIVLVLFNGRPLALTDIIEDCDAVLEAWFPGTAGGLSICDCLFGDYNPSGRLTVSFPYHVGQEPLYYSQFATGRPANGSTHSGRFVSRYLDCPNEALFPFGYGLSYHKAEYSNLTLSQTKISKSADDSIQVSITVTNTSGTSGTETVQLYLRDLVGSVVRPILELKDFKQIYLGAHETKKITFTITEEMLRFYTKDYTYQSEPGNFKVFVGPNSAELLEADFSLTI